MKPKRLKQQEINNLKKRAKELSALGYTSREVSDMLDKVRSHAWVAKAIKEDIPLDKDFTDATMDSGRQNT